MDPICRFDYILRYTLYLYSSQAIKSSVRLWPFVSNPPWQKKKRYFLARRAYSYYTSSYYCIDGTRKCRNDVRKATKLLRLVETIPI